MLGLSVISLCLSLGADAPMLSHNLSRRITVDEAIQIAEQRLPQLQASRARMEGAGATAKVARGHLLPAIHVSDAQSWMWYKMKASPNFIPGTDINALAGSFPDGFQYNLFSASLRQPLLGLVHLGHDYAGALKAADAGAQDYRASASDALMQLRSNFLRYFESRAVGETALSSQKDLEEQVDVAQKKLNAGALTTADVLRLKVAAANAKQQVIAADGQAMASRAWLLEVLGLAGNGGADIEFVAPEELSNPAAPQSVQSARDEALSIRPELMSLKLRAHAADHQATARTWELLPEINIDASYVHVRAEALRSGANGPLNADSGSVGLSASWAIWEWGSTWYARESAVAQARAAAADADGMAESVGAEVAARHAELISAQSMVDVAQVQVESASEAYRVMQALSNAGSATTTDLLDAQAALTQAKMNLVRSRYEAAIASVTLQHAIGKP